MTDTKQSPRDYIYETESVPALARPVVTLLNPRPGEKILDLGCGNGALTKELADMGCDMVGVDTSVKMVSAAKAAGIDARLIDGRKLDIKEKFDAVFSHAALHWMDDQYAVVRGVRKALRDGGRFAAECGGEGCIRTIREGMKIALIKRGIDYKARNPWKYPELGLYSSILENNGFRIKYIARIDSPTPLAGGLRGWLEVFSHSHTDGFSEAEKEAFYDEVEAYCRPTLYSAQNGWIADYVRLRFLALKEEREDGE